MPKYEHIRIPFRLENDYDNNNAVINMRRKMFSNEQPEITIEWLDSAGDIDEHCYYEDLNDSAQAIVNNAIFEYDRQLVSKTRDE